MDLSSIKWEMEDHGLIHQYDLNFMTQDLATPLEGGDNYNLLINSFKNNIDTSQFKTSYSTAQLYPKPCNNSISSDHFLSFDTKTSGYNLDCIVGESEMRFSTVPFIKDHENPKLAFNQEGSKRPCSLATQAQDHVMAERKRREKLSERFVALSAVLPNLKKMDKASILGDAVKHMKQLQERLKVLQEQTKKRTVESVVLVNKSRVSGDDSASSSDENYDEGSPEIEARVSDKDVLIRIHCKNKHKGLVAKMMREIENFHLSVENSSVLPFGNFDLHVTIVAQMDDEFVMTVKDLVKKLRLALLKFM